MSTRVGDRIRRIGHAQPPLEPHRILDQVLEQERERLGDRVVAQIAELERQLRVDMGVVLRVPASWKSAEKSSLPPTGAITR